MRITENEMQFVLSIIKSPERVYNANSIAKHLNISAMGALKIARKLEKQGILNSKELGRAKFYSLDLKSEYARQYVKFLFQREAEQTHSYVKRWVIELKKVRHAEAIILFGSVLRKHEGAKDIDALFITNQKEFSKLKKEIVDINLLNDKKIHSIYQNKEDIINNIKKEDPVILNAIKGIVVRGEDFLLGILIK